MKQTNAEFSRRRLLKSISTLGSAAALGLLGESTARGQDAYASASVASPEFTGPGPNPYWNSVGELASFPQKAPMILLTDRPPQLETPRHYFLNAFTPNESFFVRWHLQTIPNAVDLKEWRLRVEGTVDKPLTLSFAELTTSFSPVSLAAVAQCSGNSRSFFQPRVSGGQWGNGAMGNALWTGVKLKEILNAAGVKSGSVQVQVEGLDKGLGPEGFGSNRFMKSLDLNNPVIDECIIAYAMNSAPLPMLNGFPVRMIVPGYFATYWLKSLSWIRVLDKPDDNYWMKTAYRIPDTLRGTTTPEDLKAGKVKTIPIAQIPVRSFLISPDGSATIPAGLPVQFRGIAFSGYGQVKRVEVSDDGGVKWRDAQLGEDLGPYSFRTWSLAWNPKQPGTYQVAVRATDVKGNVQPDEGVWNGGGFLWNKSNDSNLLSETPLSRGKPMNKRAFLRGVVAALAILAGTALHAQVQAGNYSPSDAGTIHRSATAASITGATYDAGDYPTFRPLLAPGDGGREVNTYCNVCHSPRYITMQPVLPASTWTDEVNKMIKTYGAAVPDDAAQKIIQYLQSHYTPETRKR